MNKYIQKHKFSVGFLSLLLAIVVSTTTFAFTFGKMNQKLYDVETKVENKITSEESQLIMDGINTSNDILNQYKELFDNANKTLLEYKELFNNGNKTLLEYKNSLDNNTTLLKEQSTRLDSVELRLDKIRKCLEDNLNTQIPN